MSERHLQSLEVRRRGLVERSAAQRAALRGHLVPLAAKTAAVDRAVSSVRRHPALAAGIAAAVVLLGRRRLFGWVVRGITLYTLLKRI